MPIASAEQIRGQDLLLPCVIFDKPLRMGEGSFGVLVDSVREENGVKYVSYYCRISIRRWLEESGGFENSVVSSSVGMPTEVSVFEDLPLQMWCVGWSYKG